MTFELNRCVIGDCRETLRDVPDGTFSCCITSPPYWGLRDYGHADQIGLETTPEAYVSELVGVFREVRRVLRGDGTLWLNIGDSYAARPGIGLKPKDLVGIPWLLAFALRADGWWLRSEIIWQKSKCIPEGVRDRPSNVHEHVFLLARSAQYHFDQDAVREPSAAPERFLSMAESAIKALGSTNYSKRSGRSDSNHNGNGFVAQKAALGRNIRSIWTIPTIAYRGSHVATMPPDLVKRCMLAGSPEGGAVLDPFFGSGTVGEVAELLGRKWFGCELNPEYGKLIARRTAQTGLQFAGSE